MRRTGSNPVALGELADTGDGSVAIGPFGSSMKADLYTPVGVPIVRGYNLKGSPGFEGEFVHVSEETASRFPRCVIRPGDLVFPHRGAIGEVGLAVGGGQDRWLLSTSLMKFRPDPRRADARFLFYFFRSTGGRHELLKNASQVGTPGIGQPLASLRSCVVPLPSLPEQRAIAAVLGSLDDKIHINRRMNATLEATARAIFKAWFVDFEVLPVEAARHGPVAMVAERAARYGAPRLMESAAGRIPVAWTASTIAEQYEVTRGLSYKGSGLSDSGVPLHNLNSVYEGGGYKYEGIKHYSGEYAERHRVVPGDAIVANTEQGHDRLLIGFSALVPASLGAAGLFSHHLYRLRPRADSRLTCRFISYLLNSERMHDYVGGSANGTTVNMLPIDALQATPIVVPPQSAVERFEEVAKCIEARREVAINESRKLAILRDTLLPKLLSGEVRVKGVA